MHICVITFASLVVCTGFAGASDTLQEFYNHVDSFHDASAYNSSDLCWQKWKRTLQRWKDDFHEDWNGRAKKDILLVHVGKTAGGSIKAHFEQQNIDFEQVHMHAVDEAMLQGRSLVLLSLRSPAQRLISAFNYMNPKNRKVGEFLYKDFYAHFKDVNQYAEALTQNSDWGRIARMGVGHLELDTCAYLGGVLDALKKKRGSVFAIDTNSVIEDLNKVSARLKWGKTFRDTVHLHGYAHTANIKQISMAGMMKLIGYTETVGEAALYRELMQLFPVI